MASALSSISGCAAFVTGGASGIGFGIAQALADAGARIALADVDRSALDAAADRLRSAGATVLPLVLDVRQAEAWQSAAEQAEAELGSVQLLFSNAGVLGSRLPLEQTSVDAWRWTFDINVEGSLHAIRTFVPRMRRSGQPGHVVITASLGGFLVQPANGLYSATKGAVIAMAESLRGELAGSSIGVSVLCPGLVRSNLHDNARKLAPPGLSLGPEEPELVAALKQSMDPRAVGEMVLDGILARRFWLFTHPELAPLVEQRSREILAAMGRPET